MFHPQGQGKMVTQSFKSSGSTAHGHLGRLAAVEPIDEAAVLAVMDWKACCPVGRGAWHWQKVYFTSGSTWRDKRGQSEWEGPSDGAFFWDKVNRRFWCLRWKTYRVSYHLLQINMRQFSFLSKDLQNWQLVDLNTQISWASMAGWGILGVEVHKS